MVLWCISGECLTVAASSSQIRLTDLSPALPLARLVCNLQDGKLKIRLSIKAGNG